MRVGLVAAAHRRGGGDFRQLLPWDAEVAQTLEAAQTRQLARALDRVAPDCLAEARHLVWDVVTVVSERRRQAERVHRAVRDAVDATERLRHRVCEREPREPERMARVGGATQKVEPRVAVAWARDDMRQRGRDQRRACERLLVSLS